MNTGKFVLYQKEKQMTYKLYGRYIESEGLGGYTYSSELLLGIFDSKEDAELARDRLGRNYDHYSIEKEEHE
jgi:hypothetical protein